MFGAAATVRVVATDQLAVAKTDARQVQLRFILQFEQAQCVAGLVAAVVQALPEAVQQLFHIRFGGRIQLVHVQVVVAQRVAFAQPLAAGLVGQQANAQRTDFQMPGLFAPEPFAQAIQGVEHQEMGAEQHQRVLQ
ncbi:hypothetical protein D3C77_505890 [compost metagenome]